MKLHCALRNQSCELTEYLKTLDFKDIVVKKINMLGFDKINNYPTLLSNKEKKIVSEIFGIDKMYKETDETIGKSAAQIAYEQEEKDVDNAINTLKRILVKKNDN